MPELPEVEVVRRALERLVVGRRVLESVLVRADVLQPAKGMRRGGGRSEPGSANPVRGHPEGIEETGHTVPGSQGVDSQAMGSRAIGSRADAASRVASDHGCVFLAGRVIEAVRRHGKRLAVVGDDGSAVGVHLGMTGRVEVSDAGDGAEANRPAHTHAWWRLEGGAEMRFVDPRRFGGLWDWPPPPPPPEVTPEVHPPPARALGSHPAPGTGSGQADRCHSALWFRGLGPDALGASGAELAQRLRGGRATLKAALLDQSRVAGLGNIYADEALFEARLSPLMRCDRLTWAQAGRLAAAVQTTLRAAVAAGGSTLRDYAGPSGERGGYQGRHRVYGRAGEACVVCGATLLGFVWAGRATVCCPDCQSTSRVRVARSIGRSRKRQRSR